MRDEGEIREGYKPSLIARKSCVYAGFERFVER